MRRHTIDYYMDGYQAVSYCKVCSAEGDKLIEACIGEPVVKVPTKSQQEIADDARDYHEYLLTKE